MKERIFYCAFTNEIRIYRFGRAAWAVVKDRAYICDGGISFQYIDDL